jgi:hypothetical protein
MSDQPPADHNGIPYWEANCEGRPIDEYLVPFAGVDAIGAKSWKDHDDGKCYNCSDS